MKIGWLLTKYLVFLIFIMIVIPAVSFKVQLLLLLFFRYLQIAVKRKYLYLGSQADAICFSFLSCVIQLLYRN